MIYGATAGRQNRTPPTSRHRAIGPDLPPFRFPLFSLRFESVKRESSIRLRCRSFYFEVDYFKLKLRT